MVFIPGDHLLWDFWFAPREASKPYHLFYLRAPRSLPEPEMRHGMASVGHAVSDDLVHWAERPVALHAGPAGSWDDRAIWTGSIVRHEDRYYWFYTAICHADHAQRIGLARSDDLESWRRYEENPILEADPRWYEKAPDRGEACRDPWVARDPDGDGWSMYFTASAKDGPPDGRGVIGFARSHDLIHWEQYAPVAGPAGFAELEVPQLLHLGGRYQLLFCSAKPSSARLAALGDAACWAGTHYFEGPSPTGPFTLAPMPPLAADRDATFYAGRVVEGPDGRPVFLAWRKERNGRFIGGLSDPAPVTVSASGHLHVDTSALWPPDA